MLAAPRAGPLVRLQALHRLEAPEAACAGFACSEQYRPAVPQVGHCAGARRGCAWVSHPGSRAAGAECLLDVAISHPGSRLVPEMQKG